MTDSLMKVLWEAGGMKEVDGEDPRNLGTGSLSNFKSKELQLEQSSTESNGESLTLRDSFKVV